MVVRPAAPALPGNILEMYLLSSTPDLKNQKLWELGPVTSVIISPPGDSNAANVRSTAKKFYCFFFTHQHPFRFFCTTCHSFYFLQFLLMIFFDSVVHFCRWLSFWDIEGRKLLWKAYHSFQPNVGAIQVVSIWIL